MRKIRPATIAITTLALATTSIAVAMARSDAEADADAVDPMAPAWVTGTIPFVGSPMGRTEISTDGGVTRRWNEGWTRMRAEMSDPRLSGEMISLWNNDIYDVPGSESMSVGSGIYIIENDGGRWASESSYLARETGGSLGDTVSDAAVLIGEGGYDGLMAYLVFDWTGHSASNPARVEGAIVPGTLPPTPSLE